MVGTNILITGKSLSLLRPQHTSRLGIRWMDMRLAQGTGTDARTSGKALGTAMELTDRLRADATSLRSGALRVDDAALLMHTAASGVGAIVQFFFAMRGVLQGLSAANTSLQSAGSQGWNSPAAATARLQLAELGARIDQVLQQSLWDDLPVLDGSRWQHDARLTLSTDKNGSRTATLAVQAADTALSLTDRSPWQWAQVEPRLGLQHPASGVAETWQEALSSARRHADTLYDASRRQRDVYANRGDQLAAMGAQLNTRADVLDAAANAQLTRPTPTARPESLVFDLTFNPGTLVRVKS